MCTTTVPLALADPQWKKAMDADYQALIHNHTWDLVPFFDDMNVVQCKWVFRIKFKVDGSLDKYKARLVAKGFQQTLGVDLFETFSLVIKASTIHIVFTLAVSKGWNIQQIDVNNAFLNGELHEDVFMTQSEGFLDANKPHHVCKLHKALYGLKRAPRAWFEKLRGALVAWGFQNSMFDTSLVYTHKNGNLLMLLVYVDDILITGESSKDI